MTKPVITTRAGKGSALTWTEGDTNLTNLRDATLTVKADTGGTDVVSDLNGTVTLVAGTNVTITGDNTAKTVTIAASGGSATPAGSNQQIQFNNSGAFGASSGLTYDGVSLKVSGNLESTYQNGDEGGEIFLKNAATNTTITNGVTIDVYQNKLRFFENGGSGRGYYVDITSGGNSAGTNLVSGGSSLPTQTGNTDKVLTTDGTNASWTDTLTGKTLTKYKETIYTGGSQSSAYTPNWNNGPVQTVTLTGNVTFAAPTNMVAGSSLTLILTQDGTGGRTGTWNASYKFMGGTPVLSTAAGAVDVVSVFYDGTNYVSGLSTESSSINGLTLSAQGELRLSDSDSSNYVGFKSPATVSSNKVWTLPSADGTSGQVLSTNGSGTLSWVTNGSGQAIYSASSIQASSAAGAYVAITTSWTEQYDSIGCSTSAGTFTIPAGTYLIKWSIGLISGGTGFSSWYRLYNTTDSIIIGDALTLAGATNLQNYTYAFVTYASSKTFRIEGYWANSGAINLSSNLIEITKLA